MLKVNSDNRIRRFASDVRTENIELRWESWTIGRLGLIRMKSRFETLMIKDPEWRKSLERSRIQLHFRDWSEPIMTSLKSMFFRRNELLWIHGWQQKLGKIYIFAKLFEIIWNICNSFSTASKLRWLVGILVRLLQNSQKAGLHTIWSVNNDRLVFDRNHATMEVSPDVDGELQVWLQLLSGCYQFEWYWFSALCLLRTKCRLLLLLLLEPVRD